MTKAAVSLKTAYILSGATAVTAVALGLFLPYPLNAAMGPLAAIVFAWIGYQWRRGWARDGSPTSRSASGSHARELSALGTAAPRPDDDVRDEDVLSRREAKMVFVTRATHPLTYVIFALGLYAFIEDDAVLFLTAAAVGLILAAGTSIPLIGVAWRLMARADGQEPDLLMYRRAAHKILDLLYGDSGRGAFERTGWPRTVRTVAWTATATAMVGGTVAIYVLFA